jgi:hypothetical protein
LICLFIIFSGMCTGVYRCLNRRCWRPLTGQPPINNAVTPLAQTPSGRFGWRDFEYRHQFSLASLPLSPPPASIDIAAACAICIEPLKLPPEELAGGNGGANDGSGGSAKQLIELSSCHHVFHFACLQNWIAINDNKQFFTCPTCRAVFDENSFLTRFSPAV